MLLGGYTDFEGLFSGANQHLEGTFKIEGSADGFRYKKSLIANLPFATSTITDNWKVQILESALPGAAVLFEQEIIYKIYVQSLGGGIFIARPADDDQIVINTTIINGETIPHGSAKDHLDLNYKSEFTITIGFEASPGVDGGLVTGEVETLPYLQSVYEGNVFRIIQDGWRPAGLSKIATYKVSYKPAASESAALFDDAGAMRIAAPKLGLIELSHAYGANPFTRRASLAGLREPSIWKDPTNRLWLAAIESGNTKIWTSFDDARTLKPLQADDPTDPTKKIDVIIFNSTFKYPRVIRLQNGDIAAIALKGNQIYFKRAQPGAVFPDAAFLVGTAQKTEPYSLMEDIRSGNLYAANGHGHVLVSTKAGWQWTQVQPAPTT